MRCDLFIYILKDMLGLVSDRSEEVVAEAAVGVTVVKIYILYISYISSDP